VRVAVGDTRLHFDVEAWGSYTTARRRESGSRWPDRFFRAEAFTYDWFEKLYRITPPTLILAGELDPITTSQTTRTWPARSPAHGWMSSPSPATASSGTSRRKHSR
jgi:pimeloyl-ACP methyl ester carboxylesterase